MKSITIHGLEDPLDSMIREKAKNQGLSLNKTIKKLLEEALGIKKRSTLEHKKDFLDLFGTWTAEDLKEFTLNTKDLDQVDQEDWQ